MSARDQRPPQPVAPADAGGAQSVEDVLAAVEASTVLAAVGDGTWQGPNVVLSGYRRLFGGQLLAQALAAAAVPGKVARSLHLVFVAEGRPDTPVTWSVEPVHDGRTFATRSVVARQGERVLASGLVSLHVPDVGDRVVQHSIAPVVVPAPVSVAPIGQLGAMAFDTRPVVSSEPLRRGFFGGGRETPSPATDRPDTAVSAPFRVGVRDTYVPKAHPEPLDETETSAGRTLDGLAVGPPELAVWMRAPRAPKAGADQLAHQELLAYASDLTMMVAAMRPHEGVGFGSPAVEASAVTSHTISFHRPVRVDDWLLFVQESPAAADGRAYIRGDWFDESGAVVASCAQEILIRLAGP